MSVFDEVPPEDDAFFQAAGAMNHEQLTDDEFNAMVERVSTGDISPHDPLQAVLREVRYQLRAQPPVQIGTELGEFIGVAPASDSRYTRFETPGTSLVEYGPTSPLNVEFNEIVLEPLPEPASRLHRSSMMLAAAALVVAAMIVGAGISRSFSPTDTIGVDGGGSTIFGDASNTSGADAADSDTKATIDDADDTNPDGATDGATDGPSKTLADTVIDAGPTADAGENDIALVSADDETGATPLETTAETEASPVSTDARLSRLDPTPTTAPTSTAVPPTSTPIPTAAPAQSNPPIDPVIVATSTPTTTPTTAPTSTPVPPTSTPVPTATPTSTPVVPTATPVPTSTPRPTATPSPTPTVAPTSTPRPTPTPRPTATPSPTPTSTPTPTPEAQD